MKKGKKANDERRHLNGVRLSFPSLFKRETFNNVEGKYGATLLIEKKSKTAKSLVKHINKLNAKMKLPDDRLCLKDGDDSDYDGYEDHWALRATNSRRPLVVDRDRSPLVEDDDKIYAGCYVNVIVSFWIQDNQYGKRINCNLLGVQFLRDGDSFTAGVIKSEMFDDLEDEF